jgi:hypothetical protein
MQFSFIRFNHLFIKQWKENKKAYLLGLIAIPVLLGVVSLITAYSSEFSKNNQNMILVVGSLIIGGIFCSTLLGDYAPKPRAIRSLILPTTNLERLLVAIVYGLIIFPIAYLLLVYPVILLVNYIDFEIFGNLYLTATYTFKNFVEFIFATTSILSFVLLCSLFYRKFIFVKASLSFVCLFFLLVVFNSLITNLTFGNSQPNQYSKEFKKSIGLGEITIENTKLELTNSGPFSTLEFSNGAAYTFRVSLNKNIGLLSFVLVLLFMPTMLLACFYRLKEIEL